MPPETTSERSGARKYVRGACQRCRKQKLKCDVARPCLLCVRANVTCEPATPSTATPSPRRGRKVARRSTIARNSARAVSVQTNAASEHASTPSPTLPGRTEHHHADAAISGRLADGTSGTSSSTAALLATTLSYDVRDAQSDATQPRPGAQSATGTIDVSQNRASEPAEGPLIDRPKASERLVKLLPDPEYTRLLVDTYFDRVHWFVLAFYQAEFRRELQEFEDVGRKNAQKDYLYLLLVVITIGSRYLGSHRTTLLQTKAIQPIDLRRRMLEVLDSDILSIASTDSLRAAQTCVLLCTFHLFHGSPKTAWIVSGCGLRTARCLRLNEEWNMSPQDRHNPKKLYDIQSRKRCWWSLYEVETFCAMLHGFPVSRDLDVFDPGLFDFDIPGYDVSVEPDRRSGFDLLSYKFKMSNLSVINSRILHRLYGRDSAMAGALASGTNMERLNWITSQLNEDLSEWYQNVPRQLRDYSCEFGLESCYKIEQFERDIGADGVLFDRHLRQIQALSLNFAYENTRIMIHRPLLRHLASTAGAAGGPEGRPDIPVPIRTALEVCHDAALQTINLTTLPSFEYAIRTYAAHFMSAHLFTAAVVLSLTAILDPLSKHVTAAKKGLQMVIGLQKGGPERASLFSGLTNTLQRLTRAILDREYLAITRQAHSSDPSTHSHPINQSTNERHMSSRVPPSAAAQSRTQPEHRSQQGQGHDHEVLVNGGTTNAAGDTTQEGLHGATRPSDQVMQDPNISADPEVNAPLSNTANYDFSDLFEMFPDDQDQAWIWTTDWT